MSKTYQLTKNDRVIFKNVGVFLSLDKELQINGEKSNPLGEFKNVDVTIESGSITQIGRNLQVPENSQVVECQDMIAMPGLIDCHVHPIFAGSRATETVMKSKGATYEEIYKAGGGISKSCRLTREATDEHLSELISKRMQDFLEQGVTCVEAKTGYGLSEKEELRQLNLLLKLWNEDPTLPTMVPTYLAPHGTSPEHNSLDSYLDALIEQLPKVVDTYESLTEDSNKIGKLRFDIFIEEGYFSKEQGERWLKPALERGYNAIIHADEFSESGGGQLAYELANWILEKGDTSFGKICSVDHGQFISNETLSQLAKYDIPVVLLPLTSFFSKIPYRETKNLRSSGVTPVLATDFNPGSAPIQSIWLATFLALTRSGLTKEEIIRGVTIEAAKTLGLEHRQGMIKVGYDPNILLIKGDHSDCFFDSPVGTHVEKVFYI